MCYQVAFGLGMMNDVIVLELYIPSYGVHDIRRLLSGMKWNVGGSGDCMGSWVL